MFHAGITDTFIEPERFYPGAHVFFVGSCRDVCLFEDAGFELRDCVFDFGGGLFWWLLRRPVVGTVAANVLAFGVGGINIDGSRIGTTVETWPSSRAYAAGQMQPGGKQTETQSTGNAPAGRWPANIILDLYTAQLLDEQSGISKDGVAIKRNSAGKNIFSETLKPTSDDLGYGGSGGASRFFYVAQQPQNLIEYLTNLILPTNGKLFFNLKEQETNDR